MNITARLFGILLACAFLSNSASATTPNGYFRGDDGCLHRLPWSVLQGYPERRSDCVIAEANRTKPPVYTTTTQNKVIAALECDFAAAAQATRGQALDLSKALISGSVTFALVSKDSKGLALSVAAIPVFIGGAAAPSLSASYLRETTSSDEYQFKVDLAKLQSCPSASAVNWLTSKVLSNSISGGIRFTKVTVSVAFIVTKQGSGGLKLNIVPVAIGPTFEASNVNTQKLALTFDFDKKAAPAPAKKAAASAAK